MSWYEKIWDGRTEWVIIILGGLGRSWLDSPPPPPPVAPALKSTLDFVIDLAKKNSKFYYENKEITSDKAIALLKQNPDLNVLAKDTEKKQPLVYISVEPISLEKTKN